MRMSDGQFEAAMQTVENNIYSNLAQELRDHNVAQCEALAQATHIIRRVAHQSVTEKQLLPSLVSDVRAFLSRQDKIELAEYVASLTPEQRAENERIAAKPEEIARVNALREEALARVEAERDTMKYESDDSEDDSNIDDEWFRMIIGIMISDGDSDLAQSLGTYVEKIKAGRDTARHAQAEQQEARQATPEEAIDQLTQPLCVISLRGNGAQKALANNIAKIINRYNNADEEAQGAQAGDERAAFEHWASDGGLYPKAVERRGDQYKLAQTHSYWQAWQARASLCIKNGESKP